MYVCNEKDLYGRVRLREDCILNYPMDLQTYLGIGVPADTCNNGYQINDMYNQYIKIGIPKTR